MQAEDYSTYGGTNWHPTGIDPKSLGVLRVDNPAAYLKAYRAAYNKLHKKPSAVFQTPEQKRAKYEQTLVKMKADRAAKKLKAELALTDDQRLARAAAEAANREMFAKRRRDRNLAKQAKDRHDNPEKYAERRIKKVKWAKWPEFKRFYAEARQLTSTTGVAWNVEHIYPITSEWVCGLHTPDNLRVATMRENVRKANRPFGPLKDELWEPDHYSVYWPGDEKTLAEKRREYGRPLRKAEADKRKAEAKRRKLEERAKAVLPTKLVPGRKRMTAEDAALMPAVQELLKGRAIREVARQFGKNSLKIAQYARLVDPSWKSPYHKHGRPQSLRAST